MRSRSGPEVAFCCRTDPLAISRCGRGPSRRLRTRAWGPPARVLTTIMARLSDRLPENAPGDFFVDSSCIDCATCRTLAPRVFARSDAVGLSVVGCQPSSEADALRAKMALV